MFYMEYLCAICISLELLNIYFELHLSLKHQQSTSCTTIKMEQLFYMFLKAFYIILQYLKLYDMETWISFIQCFCKGQHVEKVSWLRPRVKKI